jgi:hypothetical protein
VAISRLGIAFQIQQEKKKKKRKKLMNFRSAVYVLCTTSVPVVRTYIYMAEIYEVINLSQASREGCQCVMSGGVGGNERYKERSICRYTIWDGGHGKFLYVVSQLFPTLPPRHSEILW